MGRYLEGNSCVLFEGSVPTEDGTGLTLAQKKGHEPEKAQGILHCVHPVVVYDEVVTENTCHCNMASQLHIVMNWMECNASTGFVKVVSCGHGFAFSGP